MPRPRAWPRRRVSCGAAQATFYRQSSLLSSGFTTRVAHDQAQKQLRTAQGSLNQRKPVAGTNREALGDTELHARAAGVITARSLELGQVGAAQSVFTLAQDGERDAVLDVPESRPLGNVSADACRFRRSGLRDRRRLRQGDIAGPVHRELHGSRKVEIQNLAGR